MRVGEEWCVNLSYTTDNVAAIRETAVSIMGKLFSFYGDDFAEDTLFPNVSDLLHHEKYLLRITGIHILMVETSRRNEE